MRAYNQLDRLSLRRPARVVTVSRAFERQLIAQAGVARSRITVLHNAVNDAWAARVASIPRDAARRSLGLRPEDCVLLSIGRMSNEKGHIYLIDAARLLHARGRAVRLLMVGDGPERERLQAASDGALVTFTGQLSDPAACYAAADIMVLPSLSEGSPNVLLESMAAGLPVVATIAGGIPEIVADRESALLVPPRSPDALAAAVEEMLSRPGLRATLANCARAVIAARHTPEARARVLVELYRDLCPIS
jgi:glycosyltransferase involved in cell wall biosynthesis